VRAMLRKVLSQVADCYERAAESRSRAANAANDVEEAEYLNLERRWMMLARSYELSESVAGMKEVEKRRLGVLIPPEPPHPAVPRLTCAECGGRMRLTQIEPALKEGQTSTFACKCGFTCLRAADR
jgi:hypothetical protein